MAKQNYLEISVKSQGLTEHEAQERIHSVITHGFGRGKNIRRAEDGAICVTCEGTLINRNYLYHIRSQGNKHSVLVTLKSSEKYHWDWIMLILLLLTFNLLGISPWISWIAALAITLIIFGIALMLSNKEATQRGELDDLITILKDAERNGEFNKA